MVWNTQTGLGVNTARNAKAILPQSWVGVEIRSRSYLDQIRGTVTLTIYLTFTLTLNLTLTLALSLTLALALTLTLSLTLTLIEIRSGLQ